MMEATGYRPQVSGSCGQAVHTAYLSVVQGAVYTASPGNINQVARFRLLV
jgi:hypothetical protein